jgi:hypothetical protein
MICGLIFTALIPVLQNYLGISEKKYFYFIVIAIVLSFLSATTMAFLRGLKKFEFL